MPTRTQKEKMLDALLEKLELRHVEQGHLAPFDYEIIADDDGSYRGSCCEDMR